MLDVPMPDPVCFDRDTPTKEAAPSSIPRFVRPSELQERLGVSWTTLWRMEQRGELPRRRQLGIASHGWLEDELEEWLRQLPEVPFPKTVRASDPDEG